MTIKDNYQMVKLLLDNKLLAFVRWTKEEKNEKLEEQLMEMVFESSNYATELLFDLIKVSEDALIKSRKVDVMKTISIFMATLVNEREITGYDDSQDTIKQSLEDLIGDKEKKCGEVYFWMEVKNEYKPIPISINEDYLSKFRTPKIGEFKRSTLYDWGITQTKEFDPYMEKKINDFYKEYKNDQKTALNFIDWLMEERQFYLYGKYLNYINQL